MEETLLEYLDATQFNDPENFDLLNKGFILKTSSTEHDLSNKCFVTNIQPSKRSGKIKQLEIEKFCFNIYSQNKSGFLTESPTKWAFAIECYVANTANTTCKWLNKLETSTGKITNAKIFVYFKFRSSYQYSRYL